jgi:hypothetical protein
MKIFEWLVIYSLIDVCSVLGRWHLAEADVSGDLLPPFSGSKLIELVKGKSIPLQASTGPEGSRRLRLPDFKTIDT